MEGDNNCRADFGGVILVVHIAVDRDMEILVQLLQILVGDKRKLHCCAAVQGSGFVGLGSKHWEVAQCVQEGKQDMVLCA